MSYWANSIIDTSVLWKNVAMIEVRYGLTFQFSLFTNVKGLGIVSNELGSVALIKFLCFLFRLSMMES